MKPKDKSPTLEEKYTQIIKGSPEVSEEEISLEQPYAGRIVQTVTTYSISEKPEPIQG